MIDPRYANAGAIPFAPGYAGAQQGPATYYHHHHRHHHHKHKSRNDDSPISRDESIHKVDHSQPQYFTQNDAGPVGSGYGVPFGAGAVSGGYYAQQQYGGGNTGYANQYQEQYSAGAGQVVKHRRHHRHHRHTTTTDGADNVVQAQGIPEQLIGQRSESVLGKEQPPVGVSVGVVEGDGGYTHRRHHRRHHHHRSTLSGAEAGFSQSHQSRHSQFRTSAATDGYGHINDELIFIERGDHSPHRQEPPAGYEYKGKIEVQGLEKETYIQGQTGGAALPPLAPAPAAPSGGLCPPGWQTMVLTGGSYGPCSAGGSVYTGQLVGSASAGAGYSSYGAGSTSLPPNCNIVADYTFGGSSAGANYAGQYQGQQVQTSTSTRPTIIEVWQKRSKSETRERTPARSRERSRSPRPDFDFDKFRADILAAIERVVPRGGAETHGTQTQIHPTETRVIETRTEGPGEVRVIVQPIQPVFYMPRQTSTGPAPATVVGPAPIQQTSSAPNVVYVPRNVYVPVIKPVFVPRERVIVRPQVIHVARPVLVDRPVPVTQRPIIIDRERPIPVPVRGGAAQAAGGGSKIVREEYVYRDNLPVAYGGRCAEFAGGVNYGYVPTQQEHQYASSSTHELSSIYQGGGQAVNVGQEVYQGAAQAVNVGQEVYQGAAQAVNVGQEVFQESAVASSIAGIATGPGQIEILDAAVNPTWIRTEESTFVQRYGRPAADIVQRSKQVEQQMYSELRQGSSSGVRSASTVSYASGSGIVGDVGLPPC